MFKVVSVPGWLAEADPGVEEGVGEVYQEIYYYEDHGDYEGKALDYGVVTSEYRFYEELAYAW